MHNAAAAALGLDRVYVALRVEPRPIWRPRSAGSRRYGFDGANVTLPHKAGAASRCATSWVTRRATPGR